MVSVVWKGILQMKDVVMGLVGMLWGRVLGCFCGMRNGVKVSFPTLYNLVEDKDGVVAEWMGDSLMLVTLLELERG